MDRKPNIPPEQPGKAPAHGLTPARHVVDLNGAGVPGWVELIPAGEFSGRDGRGPYTLDAEAVQTAFASWGMPLVIDYEHQAFNAAENGQPAPAAGWINALDVRDGALWGQVEWTERAAGHVAAREYRFLSPVFDHDKAGHVLRLLGAGLTNNPNLYLTALNRRDESSTHRLEKPMDELLERIRYMLNLPVTATPEEIKGHIQRLIDAIDAPATVAMQSTLGLAEKPSVATLPELLHAAHARLQGTVLGTVENTEPDPARYVPKAEYDRVTHSLADLQAKTDSERVERTVQAAMAAHKVSPGMEAWARAYCQADAAGFDTYLETAPVLLPGGGQASHAAQRIADSNAPNPLLVDADRRAGR